MDSHLLETSLREIANPKQATPMAAYMKNQFPFLGIKTPERRKRCRSFFKEYRHEGIDWEFVDTMWQLPEREFQYVAIDYLTSKKKDLTNEHLPKLKQLIQTKSWWDSVDNLDTLVGEIVAKNPKAKATMLAWSQDEDFWLRRIAIDHQLLRKGDTDTELLEQILVNNLNQTEFFINKAIGWSLRDYSKTNPSWVRDFLNKYGEELAPLSIREASKYL